ncbi:MAG: hypothetical protein JXN61_00910 [Sedimentisphaerales bacterium]|nr:hypothetical protein [Sedimentisphaerales bacterium]
MPLMAGSSGEGIAEGLSLQAEAGPHELTAVEKKPLIAEPGTGGWEETA